MPRRAYLAERTLGLAQALLTAHRIAFPTCKARLSLGLACADRMSARLRDLLPAAPDHFERAREDAP